MQKWISDGREMFSFDNSIFGDSMYFLTSFTYFEVNTSYLCFRSYVQGAQVNPRSMQQAFSGAFRRNAAFSRGIDRYSRWDECSQYGVPPRIHVPWRGTCVPGIPQLLPQGS